jgi:aromatic ring-opening dioxygenase catalytic subunit (LigB family)
MGAQSEAAKWYKGLAKQLNLAGENAPKAILIISAHWETRNKVLKLSSKSQHDKLYFDYSGFPAHTYELQYNAPGSVELAEKVQNLLGKANIKSELDASRNFDHGVFIPLKLFYPEANIPVVEMSIDSSYDPAFHFAVGEALQSLRQEGVLIIGSGFLIHNFSVKPVPARRFAVAIEKALTSGAAEEKKQRLLQWEKLDCARDAHQQEDHLVPIFVAAGAAGNTLKAEKIGEFWGSGDGFGAAFGLISYSFQ